MTAVVKLQIAIELQKMKAEAASFAELWSQAKNKVWASEASAGKDLGQD